MSGIVVFLPAFELVQIAEKICRDCFKVIQCKRLLNENIEAEAEAAVKGGQASLLQEGVRRPESVIW